MISGTSLSRLAISLLVLAAASCKPLRKSGPPAQGMLADIGFRPEKDGFKFENQGGQFPRTPPTLRNGDVVQMFGANACVKGSAPNCKLNPVASSWTQMVNRAMNIGQCEGMAVSSLAFFQGVHKPSAYAPNAKSAHDLTHPQVGPLIGYYWAYQMTNPVRDGKARSLRSNTPVSVEAKVVEMLKRKELGVISIRSRHGGHAVSPYAVEDKGNGIHWIHIYDNNWPDRERHIIIDHNANTWAYELASLNPDVPKEPWRGDAYTHTIAVTSLQDRLKKPECPFCSGGKKAVVPGSSNGVLLTDINGKKAGRDGDNIVNEIPGAEVVESESYIPGEDPPEPIILVPADGDYQVQITGHGKATRAGADPDAHHGVAIIGDGAAVDVQTKKMDPTDHDTLSLQKDGGIAYKSGKVGEFPAIHLDTHGPEGGMHVRLSGLHAAANDQIAVKLDRTLGTVSLTGGSKAAKAFDLKVTQVNADADDKVIEQKGIRFDATKLHTIQSKPTGTGPALPLITRTVAPLPARVLPTVQLPAAPLTVSPPPGAPLTVSPPPGAPLTVSPPRGAPLTVSPPPASPVPPRPALKVPPPPPMPTPAAPGPVKVPKGLPKKF